MRYTRLSGHFKSLPAAMRHRYREFARNLRQRHGITEGVKWIRKWQHKIPSTLFNKILGFEKTRDYPNPAGKWKKRYGNTSSLIRRVKHGNYRFAHYWTPRSGHRIRQLGKGAQRGFFSHARYKTLKAYARGHGRGAH